MTIEKIQFSHPAYIEWIKQTTYPSVAIMAIDTGKLQGCWGIVIGLLLRQHCSQQSAAAFKTMEELGFETFTEGCWTMAGEMIINNEKIEV